MNIEKILKTGIKSLKEKGRKHEKYTAHKTQVTLFLDKETTIKIKRKK